MRTLFLIALVIATLAGCVVAPAYPDYSYGYGHGRAYTGTYVYAYPAPGYYYPYGHRYYWR